MRALSAGGGTSGFDLQAGRGYLHDDLLGACAGQCDHDLELGAVRKDVGRRFPHRMARGTANSSKKRRCLRSASSRRAQASAHIQDFLRVVFMVTAK